MIQTVRGLIDPQDLGITMCHEHLILDLARVRGDDDSTFEDLELVIEEVIKAKDLGVKTFIEVSCNDMGRDVLKLKEISDRCDVHIVASTGFYLDQYHSNEVRAMTPEEIAKTFIKDLTIGIDNTNIKAGVIAEIGCSSVMTTSERKVFQGAAIAAREVGCAVTTHCQLGKLALEQADILLKGGVSADKILLGHLDLANDVEYYQTILDLGVNIAFDTIGKISYLSDEKRAENLKQLIDLGYVKQLTLSQDISRKSYFSCNRKYLGYMAVMGSFVKILKSIGVSDTDIDTILIDNPKRIFNY